MTAQPAVKRPLDHASILAHTTRCSNCGAPLEITPDAVGYICEYCGRMGAVDGIEKRGYSISKPLVREENRKLALSFLRENLKGSFSESQVREEKFYAIPFWVTEASAQSSINGYRTKAKTETYTVSVRDPHGGFRTETRTRVYYVYVPVRAELNDNFVFVLCARKNAAFYGLDEIRSRVRSGKPQPLDPLPLLKEKMEFLDVEIDEGEDREWAETGAEEEHYRMARQQTTELFDCRTQTQVGEPRLIYHPIYQVDYELRRKIFRATFDGTSGSVVKAELPVPGSLRTLYAAIAYALIAVGTLVAASRLHPVTVGAGLVLSALSGLLVHQATLTERVKKG